MKLSEFKIFTKNLAAFMKLGKTNLESESILLQMKAEDLQKILQKQQIIIKIFYSELKFTVKGFLYKENHLLSKRFKKAGRLYIDKKISFDIIKLGLLTN